MEITKTSSIAINPHILIIVEKPKKTATGSRSPGMPIFSESQIWNAFCGKIGVPALGNEDSGKGTDIHSSRLADNSWLLALQTDFPLAGRIVQAAKELSLPCKWVLFDNEPNWIFHGLNLSS